MAFIECNFYSDCLMTNTTVSVIIPSMNMEISGKERSKFKKDRKFRTLYLFHGIFGDHTDWMRFSSIERYAEENSLAVVMPACANSFYADMVHGGKYWTFISEELPNAMKALFPLSDKREDNFTAGLSMGGYGAFKLALRKPEQFAAAISLSGGLDIVAQVRKPAIPNLALKDVFADPEKIRDSEDDLFYLIRHAVENGIEIPMMYQACGTEDFLYTDNLRFRDYAQNLGVNLTYTESKGIHDFYFRDEYIQKAIRWLQQ